ncbi:phosphatidylinositol kinase- protein kinase tor1, partial [Perkinsus olseni]
EWERLGKLCETSWDNCRKLDPQSAKRHWLTMAPMAAAAQFNLRDWDKMEKYVKVLEGYAVGDGVDDDDDATTSDTMLDARNAAVLSGGSPSAPAGGDDVMSFEGSFYAAILAIHKQQYGRAFKLVRRCDESSSCACLVSSLLLCQSAPRS